MPKKESKTIASVKVNDQREQTKEAALYCCRDRGTCLCQHCNLCSR